MHLFLPLPRSHSLRQRLPQLQLLVLLLAALLHNANVCNGFRPPPILPLPSLRWPGPPWMRRTTASSDASMHIPTAIGRRFSVLPTQRPDGSHSLSSSPLSASDAVHQGTVGDNGGGGGDDDGAVDFDRHHRTSDVPKGRFMYMTADEDRILKERGDVEASLMNKPTALKPTKVRGGNAGGFGGGISGGSGGGGKASLKKGKSTISSGKDGTDIHRDVERDAAAIQTLVNTLQTDGIVRIDKVMTAKAADSLRDYLIDLRARSRRAVEDGTIRDSQERFADVLLNQNRCDLKVPLGPTPVNDALLDVLHGTNRGSKSGSTSSMVRTVIEAVFDSYGGMGKYATLWELNCFMSNSGARRQLVHADNVCLEPVPGLQQDGKEPIILTCFIALQDVDVTMGPTIWMPGTHTIDAHNRFFETGRDGSCTKTDTYSPKNNVLSSSQAVVGAPLPKGSCVIFDPRVLHCAGENVCADPDKTRALFYMSFKNPKVDDPGCPSTSGYGISTAELTMEQLVSDLILEQQGKVARHLALLASSP